MNIRPKNIQKFQRGGVSTVEWTYPNSSWYSRSGKDIIEGTLKRLTDLHNKWKATRNWDDYNAFVSEVNKMNNDLRFGYVPNYLKYSKNPELFSNQSVSNWQSTIKSNYGYINDAIGNHFDLYHPISSTPTSGDNQNRGWNVDSYWAGITQDRTPWGYYNNINDIDYLDYKKKFADIGIDYRVNKGDWKEDTGNALFGFLMDNPNSSTQTVLPNKTQITKTLSNGYATQKPLPEIDLKKSMDDYWKDKNPDGTFKVPTGHKEGGYGFDWKAVGDKLKDKFPLILEAGRLIGNYYNNERVYGESLKGIRPDLMLSYNTYRLVVGDEATKQAYYRRAAEGETRAALPFTSDADKLMAYRFESRRAGNELRALGDLADNQRIRETSEQSAQHADANTQRATEVANANLKSINYANSLRHNLLALKHAANWTSIDNFLLGIGTRWRLRNLDEESILDDLFLLQEKERLLTDPDISAARTKLDLAVKKHTTGSETDWDHDDIKKAQLELERAKIRAALLSKRNYRQYKLNPHSYIDIVKTGGKITRKKKDDLLYKSTKDSVEHFRKMSKMSSDAQNRKRVKIEKLTPPPKTKKLLQGGVAPFTIYKPIVLGGETTRTTETSSGGSSKSSSKEKEDDIFEVIKELFKNLGGLPADSNGIYTHMSNLLKRQLVYGTEMSTEDLATMFLLQMLKIDAIKFNRSEFDKAKAIVDSKHANEEFAVSSDGRVAVLNQNTGEVSLKRVEDLDYKIDNPLTNQNLLDLRAYNPNLAFNLEAIRIATYATTMGDITKFITDLLNSVKDTEKTIEGYTKKDSNLIKLGLAVLAEAPEGIYKYSLVSKTNSEQINAALNYLLAVMPGNMKTLLALHTNGEPNKAIAWLAQSRLSSVDDFKIDAMTGRAAKDANGNSSGDSEGLKLDAATALITGKGYNTTIELNPGSSYAVSAKARYSMFLKHSGENMGAGISLKEASQSTLGGSLDWNKATLGGSTLNNLAQDYVILNNGDVVGVDLPTKPGDKNVPDFERLKELELLDDELLKANIEDSPENWQKVNEICNKLKIPPKYDNQGNLNSTSWNRFAAFLVVTTEKVLNDKNVILDILGVANDETREFYNSIIQDKLKNDKYSLNDGYWIFGGKEELYLGTVFVPIKPNLVAAAISGGLKISMTDATDIELRLRGYDKQKISEYKKNELVL